MTTPITSITRSPVAIGIAAYGITIAVGLTLMAIAHVTLPVSLSLMAIALAIGNVVGSVIS